MSWRRKLPGESPRSLVLADAKHDSLEFCIKLSKQYTMGPILWRKQPGRNGRRRVHGRLCTAGTVCEGLGLW